jgi:seryl-tRNA synthetase
MLDVKFIRDNPDIVRDSFRKRHNEFNLDELLRLEQERRDLLFRVEQLKRERNESSEEIARLKRDNKDASAAIAKMREVAEEIKKLDELVREKELAVRSQLLLIPNIPHQSVPEGTDERDNREERRWGEPRQFSFEPKDHADIGENLGILDFERAARLSRTRFTLSMDLGAKLERALMNFMLDLHTREHGYIEVLPPFLVNADTMTGTGNLPKFASELFKCESEDLYLVPTAEVPLTNIHKGETLEADLLPLLYTAYTPCFRSEAGSYGKDTRGLMRQHQFNKVELVRICQPESSYDELERLVADAEEVLKRLELPYRVVTLCTGDMGFAVAKTYDIEVWIPSQERYREISSCSNCTDFQARRANIRFKRDRNSKPEYVHTLNGSGLAIGRTVIAILENYQEADGTVAVPQQLQPYLDGVERITPERRQTVDGRR